jgi:hypothetical protein
MEAIKLSGKYTFDDYKKANDLHAQVPLWIEIASHVSINVTFLFIIIPFIVDFIETGDLNFILFVGIYITVIFGVYWYPRRQLLKRFNQDVFFENPFEIEITDEYFKFSNEVFQTKQAWKDYVKWRESREMILVYPYDTGWHPIPKRLFNDEGDEKNIKRLLQENGVPLYKGPILQKLALTIILSALIIFFIFYTFLKK